MMLEDDDGIIQLQYLGGRDWKYKVTSTPDWLSYTEGQSEDITLEETDVTYYSNVGYTILADITNETSQGHTFFAGYWTNDPSHPVTDSSVEIDAGQSARLWMQGVMNVENDEMIHWSITTPQGDPRFKITYKKT